MEERRKWKLQQYAAFASGLIASTGHTHAQVVYTDVDPDILLFNHVNDIGSMQFVDMDADGSDDIGLHFYAFYYSMAGATHWQFDVDLPGENKITTVQGDACSLYSISSAFCYFPPATIADIKENGDLIDPSAQWENIDALFQQFWCGTSYPGHCTQADFVFIPWFADTSQEMFLPVELHNAETHYGWLRLRFIDQKLYITDMAYNQTPNAGMIIEEQEYTDVPQSTQADIQVYVAQHILHIDGLTEKTTIRILDTSGKMLFSKESTDKTEDFLLDIPDGFYLVTLHNANGNVIKKISVF